MTRVAGGIAGNLSTGKDKIMKRMTKIGALALLAMSAMTASGFAGDTQWGAFAVDTSDKTKAPYYGVGGGDTEKEASDYAMKFCKEEGGKECTLAMTYQQCGALASNGKSIGWGMAPTQKEAEQQSIQGCKGDGCKIVASDCN